MNFARRTGFWLFLGVGGFLVISGIHPVDRFTWVLEVSWVVVGMIVVVALAGKGTVGTPLLNWCLFLHAIILIYGGWHTYELTPLGEWMKSVFGFERNHYDRLGHFAQGFFPTVLYREVLFRRRVINGRWWLEAMVFTCAMAFTGIFELIEFASALAFGGASDAYLGSQGDVWDAQWDMTWCGLGALVSIGCLLRPHWKQLQRGGRIS